MAIKTVRQVKQFGKCEVDGCSRGGKNYLHGMFLCKLCLEANRSELQKCHLGHLIPFGMHEHPMVVGVAEGNFKRKKSSKRCERCGSTLHVWCGPSRERR